MQSKSLEHDLLDKTLGKKFDLLDKTRDNKTLQKNYLVDKSFHKKLCLKYMSKTPTVRVGEGEIENLDNVILSIKSGE